MVGTLKAFTHLKEIDLPPHITQIQRNHPDIAEFFKQAWDWEMAPGRESNDAMKEAKALEKSGDNDSHLEPSEPVVGIFVQTDSHGLDTGEFDRKLAQKSRRFGERCHHCPRQRSSG